MAQWTIYDKNGVERTNVRKFSYEGVYMGESNIQMDIVSETPIPFEIDDYIDYRGERYVMSNLPSVERIARDGSYGAALRYNNVVFRSMAIAELENCMMLDYVVDDNKLHYTSLPNFSFYCDKDNYVSASSVELYSAGVRQLADRILANTTRLYGENSWQVRIEDETYMKESLSISVSNQNVWNVMADTCDKMNINFTARVLVENGSIVKREIVLGAKMEAISNHFKYGKGNGLISLERNAVNGQDIITRLTAYGNTRNIPYRYYNYLWYVDTPEGRRFKYYRIPPEEDSYDKTTIVIDLVTWTRVCNPAMYVPNLMLPMFRQNGKYAYVDSGNISELGVKEGVKFFNQEGEDSQDIYPSLTGMTTDILWDSMTPAERQEQNIPEGKGIEVDRLADAEQVSFTGIIPEEQESAPRFTIILENLGFDPNETIIDNESPAIEMKSGMCVGRKFNVLSFKKNTSDSLNWYYEAECEVDADNSINQYFPNINYQIKKGDQFVLTGIRMPDVYVSVAEKRLEAAALAWLAENDHAQYTYTPKIDNIFMAKNPTIADAIKEGLKMSIDDDSLGIHETIIISQLKIEEGNAIIPEWEVTLSNEIEPTLAQRVVEEISAQIPVIGGSGGGMSQTMYNNIITMLNNLPKQYISKINPDRAEGCITINEGIETGGFREGNGVKVTNNMIDVVSVGQVSMQVGFGMVSDEIGDITRDGSRSVENHFAVNAGLQGGVAYVPFSCGWSAIKITNTTMRVIDDNGELVYEKSFNNPMSSFVAEVPLNEEDRDVTYTVYFGIAYKSYPQILGSLIMNVGDKTNNIVTNINAGSEKTETKITSSYISIMRSEGVNSDQTDGMLINSDGMKALVSGQWFDVELQLI